MTKFSLLFLLSYASAWIAKAQEELVWAMGTHAGLDFSSGTPRPILTSMDAWEGCSSTCDPNGNLLFYSNGSTVWDRQHLPMPNGEDLTGKGNNTTSSASQGTLIMPVPGKGNQYYLFSIIHLESTFWGRLSYSIIDMSLNNGMGDVVPGKKAILLDTNLTEHMAAISGNQCNFWLIVVDYFGNQFKTYNIDQNGISVQPVLSPRVTGYRSGIFGGSFGYISFSPNGLKMAMSQDNLVLYDFDPATAKISNPIILGPANSGYYGICFSPNNTKLYACNGELVQYDLKLSDSIAIKNSRFILNDTSTCFAALKTGPDQKIYFIGSHYNTIGLTYASIIQYPDNSGAACGFTDRALYFLPDSKANYGLPNQPFIPPYRRVSRSAADTALCGGKLRIKAIDTTGYDYTWDDGSNGYSRMVDTTGVYWVRYNVKSPCRNTTFDYTDTLSVHGARDLFPVVTTTASCKGENNGSARCDIYAAIDSLSIKYIWLQSNGDTLSVTKILDKVPAGYYTLQISALACATILNVRIEELEAEVSFATDDFHCQDLPIQIKNTSSDSFKRFRWDWGDGSQDTLQHPVKRYQHPGKYTLQLMGQGDHCNDTFRQSIVVDTFYANKWIANSRQLCVGEAFLLTATISDPAIQYLYWHLGNGERFQSQPAQLSHAFDKAGSFPVTLTTQFRACPDYVYNDTLHVAPLPIVDLGPDTLLCFRGIPLLLHNLKSDSIQQQSYLWNTGDTTQTLVAKAPGHYSLSIQMLPSGCSNSASTTIHKKCYLDIPNAFTPNRDGYNDFFFPRRLAQVKQFRMQIWNRWGQLIYDTRQSNGKGWDGTWQEQAVAEGIYLYQIEVTNFSDQREEYKGNVTLIR